MKKVRGRKGRNRRATSLHNRIQQTERISKKILCSYKWNDSICRAIIYTLVCLGSVPFGISFFRTAFKSTWGPPHPFEKGQGIMPRVQISRSVKPTIWLHLVLSSKQSGSLIHAPYTLILCHEDSSTIVMCSLILFPSHKVPKQSTYIKLIKEYTVI